MLSVFFFFFFFKQKTAYEIGTGDWSSDVCSSDLNSFLFLEAGHFFYDLLVNGVQKLASAVISPTNSKT